jgi:hypothetical protein
MRLRPLRVQQEDDMQTQQITGGLAVTAIWEAREGEADTVADILARFAPQGLSQDKRIVRKESGDG